MEVIFLDIDGVLNSHQSMNFWHHNRDRIKRDGSKTFKEYSAQEYDPIALSNMEELIREVPSLKVVVSSTWRLGTSIGELKSFFSQAPLLADAIIDKTPDFNWEKNRGYEIQDWLDKHPEVTNYVIIDDDNDMLESQQKNLVHTSVLHGFQYGDMLWALRILGIKHPLDDENRKI